MLEFFSHLMIVTGGVICCLLWLAIIIAGLVELIDVVTGSGKNVSSKTEDTYVDLDGE